MRSTTLALLLLAAVSPLSAANHNVAVGPGNSFSPATVNATVGDTVTWTLMGGFHNVRANDGSFLSGPVGDSWGPFVQPFNSAGSFGYQCDAHGPSMSGVVNVAGGGTPGSLSFTSSSASVSEGAASVTVTVRRSGGDDGAVSVQYETAIGSATSDPPGGGDFIQTNGTLTWPDNDDDDRTITIQILNDTAIEGSESFVVNLFSPTGGATLGANPTITVTIQDNDGGGSPGTLRFTQGAPSFAESAGAVSIVAERTGGAFGAVSAQYTVTNGSATSPGDFTSAGSGTLSWANGDGATKSVPVTIVNDGANEGNETFTVTLSNATGGATLGSPSTATVTITDDDSTCVPSTCVSDTNNLCLAGGSGTPGRFRISVQWTDFVGGTGAGVALPYTADSGFFYFFDPANVELLVKIVNGCGLTNSYWFFNAAASNVGLVYTVTDLQTCQSKSVTNPLGTFASNGDVGFFPTSCP